MDKKTAGFISFLEGFVTLMILLVLVQTFLEDFMIITSSSYRSVHLIKISAVFFDLFFTIEFFTRLFSAAAKKKTASYFISGGGWIDLIASLPLLLLVSGPYFLLSFTDLGIVSMSALSSMSMIKLIKAVRVARILRLLRILKLFGSIKNTNSIMAQRHINYILSMIIIVIITYSFSSTLLKQLNFTSSPEAFIKNELSRTTEMIGLALSDENVNIDNFLKTINSDDIIFINKNGKLIHQTKNYSSYDLAYMLKHNNSNIIEITPISDTSISVTYYTKEIIISDSTNTLYNFILIIILVGIFLTLYLGHFAQTVTDPIFIMRNGFEKMSYTLAVKIPEKYADDDIFKLSDDYNKRWLPAKIRKLEEKSNNTTTKLSLDDVFGDNN